MNHESKRPIEIEDLVRLKRAERPPAEFWSEFDRQLRAKQLAALVAKRPWWQTLPRLFTGFTRYHIPLGATAILAVTFVSLRDRSPGVNEPGPAAPRAAVGGASTVAPLPVVAPEIAAQATVMVSSAATSRNEAGVAPAAEIVAAPSLASEATSPGELSRIIPLLGASGAEPAAANEAAEPRYVASSFAAAVKAEPVLSRSLLAANNGFEPRVAATRPAIEPLHQMTPPGERSRARMFTALVATMPAEVPSRTSERVIGRLDEERLYEQVRRFGARGAGMSISF